MTRIKFFIFSLLIVLSIQGCSALAWFSSESYYDFTQRSHPDVVLDELVEQQAQEYFDNNRFKSKLNLNVRGIKAYSNIDNDGSEVVNMIVPEPCGDVCLLGYISKLLIVTTSQEVSIVEIRCRSKLYTKRWFKDDFDVPMLNDNGVTTCPVGITEQAPAPYVRIYRDGENPVFRG